MVLQMPYPDQARVFVASSDENAEQARQEVMLWASGHGYQVTPSGRTFLIFRPDAQPREWVLLERAATDSEAACRN
jgi:hypothetical protein